MRLHIFRASFSKDSARFSGWSRGLQLSPGSYCQEWMSVLPTQQSRRWLCSIGFQAASVLGEQTEGAVAPSTVRSAVRRGPQLLLLPFSEQPSPFPLVSSCSRTFLTLVYCCVCVSARMRVCIVTGGKDSKTVGRSCHFYHSGIPTFS